MTRQRTFTLVAAGLLGAAALTACGSEDSRTVGAVAVDGLSPASSASEASASPSASSPSAGPSAAGSAAAVSALQTVQGVLERDVDDSDDDSDDDRDDPADRYDDFTVNGVEVDFGPSEWVVAAPVLQDYDRDGTAEPFAAELDGLVGQQVTLQVRDDEDDDDDDRADDRLDDADVYEVNGLALRDITGPAPWRGGPVPTGALAG
ncbi:hypothetical protein FHN55_00425 [Streptomyces sp. NP160]|uniref:hypothetical protein n=1 Tax=Streptomyces sp. NP160 TaxID=2586637 RepID=UPI00111ACF02|nr:hypothetical protein [Streptomyces sp. NP160]TNM70198.1 hypothetical protein FHN55_00425 [Streptomyces sp. NP160]